MNQKSLDKDFRKALVKNGIDIEQFLLTSIHKALDHQKEQIMIEIEIMRGHEDDKIDYLPLYKFLKKL